MVTGVCDNAAGGVQVNEDDHEDIIGVNDATLDGLNAQVSLDGD